MYYEGLILGERLPDQGAVCPTNARLADVVGHSLVGFGDAGGEGGVYFDVSSLASCSSACASSISASDVMDIPERPENGPVAPSILGASLSASSAVRRLACLAPARPPPLSAPATPSCCPYSRGDCSRTVFVEPPPCPLPRSPTSTPLASRSFRAPSLLVPSSRLPPCSAHRRFSKNQRTA